MSRRLPKSRRGFALVIVLGMIALALGVSYAALRTQAYGTRTQVNGQLRVRARLAAHTGFSAALRQMHESTWAGADTTWTGNASATDSFTVAYVTGDASLPVSGPGSEKWPYRVTLQVTGRAVEPGNASVSATHTLRAVVELVPQAMPAEPADWSSMLAHTVYQWAGDEVSFQGPGRVEGPMRLQGRLRLYESYPKPSAACTRYLADLNALRLAGQPDWRPFVGPVKLPFSQTGSSTRSLLTDDLQVSVSNEPVTSPSGWTFPGTVSSYQLYPGGKTYSVPTVGAYLEGQTLGPDPRTNPLGFYFRSGNVAIGDDVALRGTLIATGDVELHGETISLEAVDLPALAGTTAAVRLPTVIVGDDFRVEHDAQQAVVRGVVAVWDDYRVEDGADDVQYLHEGHVIARDFDVGRRDAWSSGDTVWSPVWQAFQDQLNLPVGQRVDNFATWLGQRGLSSQPRIVVRPLATGPSFHWKKSAEPVYSVPSGSSGLRWAVVDFVDSPPSN